MVAAGAGEYYLKNTEKLVAAIKALKAEGVTVSVKIRVGVAADDRALARAIWAAGADIIHVDLMDSGAVKLRQIRNSCPLIIIANNSINTFEKMRDMLSHGADLVSLARKSDKETLAMLDAEIKNYADTDGWYNSPKQLCRGGDIRAAHLLLHAGKGMPAHSHARKSRDDQRGICKAQAQRRSGHTACRWPPYLFREPCLVLQDLLALHVPGHDAHPGRTPKERIYAPQARAF